MKLSYRNAINQALKQAMKADGGVFVYGIDVDDHKRIFGTTNDLVEDFGHERCFSTPLCEDSLVGFGLGAAIAGLRPVNIHMRADFLLLAVNQLFNMVASYSYGCAGQRSVPLTIRAVIGKGWGQAYQHSKSLQSIYAHVPGLKVVMPTTPLDAGSLLLDGIKDNNPVIILEHRLLYDIEDEVSEADILPLDKARVLKPGKDVTLIATSYMNVEAMHAAKILSANGIEVEVIDLRSIQPIDVETLVSSVNKTGYCMIADYDWIHCGASAEVATLINEHCFGQLKQPIKRLGFAPTHCPTTRSLEDLYYPNAEKIVRDIEKLLNLDTINLEQEVFFNYENQFRGPF